MSRDPPRRLHRGISDGTTVCGLDVLPADALDGQAMPHLAILPGRYVLFDAGTFKKRKAQSLAFQLSTRLCKSCWSKP